jgi:hypothetical protein
MMATKDGMDLYDVAIRRIHQLEALNATLAAQVDRQAKVVEAAQYWYNNGRDWSTRLAGAVATYEEQMAQLPLAQLAKEG